jgi:hypothetical protein
LTSDLSPPGFDHFKLDGLCPGQWESNPTVCILPVLFHELSHIYGTLDDPSPFLYALNVTEFQGLYNFGLNSTYYEMMERIAQFRCGHPNLSGIELDIYWGEQ